jgi:hypothetical protein
MCTDELIRYVQSINGASLLNHLPACCVPGQVLCVLLKEYLLLIKGMGLVLQFASTALCLVQLCACACHVPTPPPPVSSSAAVGVITEQPGVWYPLV